jgi:peroxiredoxin/tetratricopeptide (TPR) repeat protein
MKLAAQNERWRGFIVRSAVALLLLLAIDARAQIVRLAPEQPRWGGTLTISYDTALAGAKFTTADEVYVTAQLIFPGFSENVTARMTRVGSSFKHELRVPEQLASVAVHFITLNNGWDEPAYTTALIYRADGQPARGAYESKIRAPRYQEFFKQETALYPDNYSAYRAKWAALAVLENDKLSATINADVKKLSRAHENAELLSVLAYGYLLMGNEARSRALIQQLGIGFPDSPFTARAINDYEEQVSNWEVSDESRRTVAGIKLAIIQLHPATTFARQAISALANDARAPLAVIEKIARLWMQTEPENPRPYYDLALAYRNQYQKYEQAAPLIESAIELLLTGKLRLYGDVSGQRTATLLPAAYLISAELAFRQKQTNKALAALKIAQSLNPQPAYAAQLLEAKVWDSLKDYARAEAAFIKAWRNGSQEAVTQLQARYRQRHGDLQGFDDYLLKSERGGSKPAWKHPAPHFKATTLDGRTFDLSALQGRIVVINLWFLGCSPCRKEIPRLNDLVNEFQNEPVVFLAPSFDSADMLKRFLRTTPFNYHVIADADEIIIGKFNAVAFPTHIVIDRDGLVETVLAGADEGRPEEIKHLLRRLLAAPATRR